MSVFVASLFNNHASVLLRLKFSLSELDENQDLIGRIVKLF